MSPPGVRVVALQRVPDPSEGLQACARNIGGGVVAELTGTWAQVLAFAQENLKEEAVFRVDVQASGEALAVLLWAIKGRPGRPVIRKVLAERRHTARRI